MNAKALTILAVLAVAAVAVVGAGYAYYWGQTQVTDNQVDVEYLTVQTDMSAIDQTVAFNSIYNQEVPDNDSTADVDESVAANFTITPAGSSYSTIGGEEYIPVTRATDGTALGYGFTIMAPIETLVNSYEFQVKLTNVTLGANATLYFGISTAEATQPTALSKFVKDGDDYIAILPANALAQIEQTGIYSVTQYGFLYLSVKDDIDGTEGIQVLDVKTAKCAIDSGVLTYQALKNKIVSETEGLVVTFTELDGFTPSVIGGTGQEYDADNKKLTFAEAGTYLVKFTAGSDVFYKEYTVQA